jgi:hypothetical protein
MTRQLPAFPIEKIDVLIFAYTNFRGILSLSPSMDGKFASQAY